ncbi:MAG: hypothetical protein K9N35_01490 [Candidatus Marinimicrobia bacterium]|nr:hypothetical protein [Candidatus Neomarinimicrobiota bacterium]
MHIIYQNNFNKLKPINSEPIVYLGYDFIKIEQLLQMGIETLDIRKLISTVAHGIKYDFIDYIASIGKKQKDSLKWWASRIASKSNLQTDFFSYVCLLKTFDKLNAENNCSIVLVDDFRLYQLLSINYTITTPFSSRIKALGAYYFSVIIYLVKAIPARLWFLFARLREDLSNKHIFNTKKDNYTYIYSWIEDRSIASDGSYNDPYFPGIHQYSKSKKFVLFCGYNVKTSLKVEISRQMAIDGLSSYSSPIKILRSVFYIFRPKEITKYDGFKLNPLWFFETLSENTDNSYISKIHEYLCWEDFFVDNSGTLIYPFENQPWEKVMLQGIANSKSEMKSIGCLHTTTHRLLLPFHTTTLESSYLPLPEILFVNSSATERLYCEYFDPLNVEIVNAGSLRFPPSIDRTKREASNKVTIGIMLSCIRSQTNQQLFDLEKNNNLKVEYLVKPHPDTPVKPDESFPNVSYFNGSAAEYYGQVDAIVYCSSTSGLEAFSYGLPVFRLRTQYLDLETGEDDFKPVVINSVAEIDASELIYNPHGQVFSEVQEDIWVRHLN